MMNLETKLKHLAWNWNQRVYAYDQFLSLDPLETNHFWRLLRAIFLMIWTKNFNSDSPNPLGGFRPWNICSSDVRVLDFLRRMYASIYCVFVMYYVNYFPGTDISFAITGDELLISIWMYVFRPWVWLVKYRYMILRIWYIYYKCKDVLYWPEVMTAKAIVKIIIIVWYPR